MDQVFLIVRNLTNRIVAEVNSMPSEGHYTFFITKSKEDGEVIELEQSNFGFTVNSKRYNALNMSNEFVQEMIYMFRDLREQMEKTSDSGIKWDEATLRINLSKEVKMNYKYPQTTIA